MSELDRLREEYQHALRSTYVDRGEPDVGRTYYLVDEDKADALITALEAELERLKGERDRQKKDSDNAHATAEHYAKLCRDGADAFYQQEKKLDAMTTQCADAILAQEQAEAEVALRDRMLHSVWLGHKRWHVPTADTEESWLADLRARAEKEAADA